MKARKSNNQTSKEEMAQKFSLMTFEETMTYVRTNVAGAFRIMPAAGQVFDALLDKFENDYKLLKEENEVLKAELNELKGVSNEAEEIIENPTEE